MPRQKLHPVDASVGKRMRTRRNELGLSMGQLCKGIGVSLEQVRKYEEGTNRISASRLFCLAQKLEVTVGYFFEDVGSDNEQPGRGYSRAYLDIVRNLQTVGDAKRLTHISAVVRELVAIK